MLLESAPERVPSSGSRGIVSPRKLFNPGGAVGGSLLIYLKSERGINMRRNRILAALGWILITPFMLPLAAQEVLPFPPQPSGSTAGRTMQESIYSPAPKVSHVPKNAPM